MPEMTTIATIVIKVVKIVLNLIILILYRKGYGGEFLGIGGTWNLNEEKNPDAEIIASGVLVGFFIYTSVILISYAFGTTQQKKTLVDVIMNIFGTVLFIAIGGIALHYWIGYQPEHKFKVVTSEKGIGITVGILCVISGAIYLIDSVLSCIHFFREYGDY
ncbi:protein snakeskin-like [Planococcus citri]|uniref:protein snakeskin-like n=1 Tax=Planococcus citri TaxID=170843 RepID=UPI0031F73B19